ncbi:2-hydroxyacid dehydrogenase [Pseudosulfitobacter koreensis]|uniref:Glyoxylate/hydroxypyruvate reductase A n=1 Tax=Pseudosulfitobacter koreensis TaxID=2968472 RepID=A0ABT1YYA5_9RHOB|nr:glyoxylate/hydroxypyruvate reductase A [Pseudosulfitobacter koreense]MCR8825867.1 glyoxylate/hydroxypyruvate reductase A [Pseudosulfitobacter koreense]
MALLFLSSPERAAVWGPMFDAAGEGFVVGEEAVTDPAEITHLMCWLPPKDLRRYPKLKVVIGAGAGVDHMPRMPEGVTLVRTLAPGIDEMVRDWVVMATLMVHRDMPTYLRQAQAGQWTGHVVPRARGTRVGIMGMGRIGTLAARTLSQMEFDLVGWSRSGRPVDGCDVFGSDRLDAFLAQSEILICLLPLTDETHGILNADLFAKLPQGARLVQAGRGAQLDMDALKQALNDGRLTSAMLDVTNPEPLPETHWAWRDPRVVITPHVAANTDHAEGARHALEVVRASRENRELPGRVDQDRGY